MAKFLDDTIGRWARHFMSVVVRLFLLLFFNVSCSGRHLLSDLPDGALIFCTHISRLDGPLVAASLYATRRVRPAVHYDEYYHPLQWPFMYISGAIALSSPKHWPPEQRAARRAKTFGYISEFLATKDSFLLLFPAGMGKRQPREIIPPHFSGAYEILKASPEKQVVIIRLQGLGRFDQPKYDLFWSFIPGLTGRRHVEMSIEVLDEPLNTTQSQADFNADLETRLNDLPPWPQVTPGPQA